jgi:hypothetical protein
MGLPTVDDLPQNDIAYECATKQFDFLDRTFDGLTARASTIMGWSALAVAGATYIQARMQTHAVARWVFVLAVFVFSLATFIFAALAFRIRGYRGWPKSRETMADYGRMGAQEARFRLTCDLIEAIEQNESVIGAKRRTVRISIYASFALMLTLLFSVIVSSVLPSPQVSPDTPFHCKERQVTETNGSKQGSSQGLAPPTVTPVVTPTSTPVGREPIRPIGGNPGNRSDIAKSDKGHKR